MKRIGLSAFAAALFALANIAQANPIWNFQFQTYGHDALELPFSGNGVLREDGSFNPNPTTGAASGSWNQIQFSFSPSFSSTPTSGFVTGTGASSDVTVTFNPDVVIGMDAWPGGPYGALANQPLMTGYLGTNGTNEPFVTVGGLTPGGLYDLILYGNNSGDGAGAAFSVNGSATYSTTNSASGAFESYVVGTDYVQINNVAANSMGQLQVTGLPSTISIGIENGLQILAVPEPATGLLLVLGLSMGLGWRTLVRRRR